MPADRGSTPHLAVVRDANDGGAGAVRRIGGDGRGLLHRRGGVVDAGTASRPSEREQRHGDRCGGNRGRRRGGGHEATHPRTDPCAPLHAESRRPDRARVPQPPRPSARSRRPTAGSPGAESASVSVVSMVLLIAAARSSRQGSSSPQGQCVARRLRGRASPRRRCRNRRRARCSRPRAVTVWQPSTAAICAGARPSHSESRSTSRSPGASRRSASWTSAVLGRRGLGRGGRRFERQPLLQGGPAAARPPLIRERPPRGRVEPHARRVAGRHVVETAPRRQEHLGGRVLAVARGTGPPAAVRDDVGGRTRRRAHRSAAGDHRHVPSSPPSCPARARTFDPTRRGRPTRRRASRRRPRSATRP